MDRLLIVPAAGRGSRLGGTLPKALVEVAGRPMLDHLIDLHASTTTRILLVVAPDALDRFRAFAAARTAALEFAVQDAPTGMLDAILAGGSLVSRHRPSRVVITWCDQIALTRRTVTRLAERARAVDAAALVLPTLRLNRPYIHFVRDSAGLIVGVRQRREGDAMPDQGESDLGIFDLSVEAYLEDLPAYAPLAPAASATGERNFLPFVPWLAARRTVETFPGSLPIEAVGVNTPEERDAVEAHLRRTSPRVSPPA